MAFFLGKLVLLGGAALVGSIVIEKGRLPTVTESVSGAFKVLRTLNGGDSGTSKSKSDNAAVTQEIKNLQHQLQFLDSNRQMVIVSSNSSGSTKYGVIIVVVVVGYGFVWWKGWKLSDMMFATKRSLADACGNVSKQLETVYVAIDKTRRQLSSRIDNTEGKVDEWAVNNAGTKDDVTELKGDVCLIGTDVKTIRETLITLETRLIRFEGKEDKMQSNLGKLVNYVRNNFDANNRPIEGFSRTTSVPALENSQGGPARTLSLPPASPMGSSTPSPSNRASQAPNGMEMVELSSQNSAAKESGYESSSFLAMGSSGKAAKVVTRKLSSNLSFSYA